MAITTMELDPNATSYTDDEIIAKINAAADQITREDAVDAEALDIITTGPIVGEFKVKKIHRGVDGKLQVEYDDVAVE